MVSLKNKPLGNSLAVQWLGLQAFIAKGAGSVPDRGTKVPQASWQDSNIHLLVAAGQARLPAPGHLPRVLTSGRSAALVGREDQHLEWLLLWTHVFL